MQALVHSDNAAAENLSLPPSPRISEIADSS